MSGRWSSSRPPGKLLADGRGHLAGRGDVLLLPVRRLGAPDPSSPPPSPYRLSLAFMAAAPGGVAALSFEDEEAAIQQATRSLGLDLTVEEGGTLRSLAECFAHGPAEAGFDVLHLSCHGGLHPPCLLLEDDYGDPRPASADELASSLGLAPCECPSRAPRRSSPPPGT